jgi:Domain of unknown function (DUF6443)
MLYNRTKRVAKRIVCVLFHSFFLAGGFAQPSNKPTTGTLPVANNVETTPSAYPSNSPVNYVRAWEALGAHSLESDFTSQSYTEVKQTTVYLNGLGRPIQTVLKQATPESSPKDLVNPFLYDGFGREQFKYMGYAASSSNGNFKADPFNEQKTFLQNQYPGEQVFYSKTQFEASPLNRTLKSFAQGNHSKRRSGMEYWL